MSKDREQAWNTVIKQPSTSQRKNITMIRYMMPHFTATGTTKQTKDILVRTTYNACTDISLSQSEALRLCFKNICNKPVR
jgi:hypothetical protein